MIDEAKDVLRFWFPEDLRPDHARMVRQFEWWFRGGADDTIVSRFASLHEQAARGACDHWDREPRQRLALILVLDQFSRSIHRATPRAFAQDTKALGLTLEGIQCGHYAALASPWEKTFFFMPLGHSEKLEHLDRAIELADELAEEGPAELREVLEHSASQARGHREVIARFGRHPHRNGILGRPSTPEEIEFLATTQPVHTRSIPQ
jgi:uncharacterized protein (DUF924 family)